MIAFVSEQQLAARQQASSRPVSLKGCADPDDMPEVDYVNTHPHVGMAIRVFGRILAGTAVVLVTILVAL